jgi:hypothetical protein
LTFPLLRFSGLCERPERVDVEVSIEVETANVGPLARANGLFQQIAPALHAISYEKLGEARWLQVGRTERSPDFGLLDSPPKSLRLSIVPHPINPDQLRRVHAEKEILGSR